MGRNGRIILKILSIDTASNICGVSILENTSLICKLDKNTGRTHSENLMPMIQQAFYNNNLTLSDIDLIVCDKGPGSFTGIRIGVATAKAFQDSLEIPCIGISSLESFAYSIEKDGFIASILDAKNDNCYFALYEKKDTNYHEILAPTADTIKNALQTCKQYASSYHFITLIGDSLENYKDLIYEELKQDHFFLSQNIPFNSYYLGLAGFEKWKKNKIEDVLPLYLKKPQAQRQLEEKFKNIEIKTMTLDDFQQISSHLKSDFDDFWTPSTLKEELLAKNSHYLVATFNQEIVGFAGIKCTLDESDLMNIVTKKSFRNQGIASTLLKNLIHLAKKLACTSISLEVMEENYPAIHLYKKVGFEQVGIRKNYYQDKNGLTMTKKLLP